MAQLTLSQRADFSNSLNLQRRLISAAKKTANYWTGLPLDTVAKFNVGNHKRKIFARQILTSSVPNIQSYAEYLVNQYNEQTPVLNTAGELDDSVLIDSQASAATFDFFAGVQSGDDSKQIIL